jgi:hypothetical protein
MKLKKDILLPAIPFPTLPTRKWPLLSMHQLVARTVLTAFEGLVAAHACEPSRLFAIIADPRLLGGCHSELANKGEPRRSPSVLMSSDYPGPQGYDCS